MSYDREEGEIDSDEGELRKRIEELENENREYEKIAKISGLYANTHKYCDRNGFIITSTGGMSKYDNFSPWDVQRAGRVPTDASSISSIEFVPPKKRKRKKSKVRRSRSRDKRLRSHFRHHAEKHGKNAHSSRRRRRCGQDILDEHKLETISLDSSESLSHEKHSYLSTEEEESDNIMLPLSREELRLALARSKNGAGMAGTLKERLEREKRNVKIGDAVEVQNKTIPSCNSEEKLEEANSDDSVSLEEQELRLIALRSAIMKKHLTRKKRNAELAYSPTDFEELLIDSVSSVGTDLDDLTGEMEISPVVSPKLLLSPVPCDEQSTSSIRSDTNNVDTKPVDMDIANSDSDGESHTYIRPCFNQWSQSESVTLPAAACLNDVDTSMAYSYMNAVASVPYSMYVPNTNFKPSMQLSSIDATSTIPLQNAYLQNICGNEQSKETKCVAEDYTRTSIESVEDLRAKSTSPIKIAPDTCIQNNGMKCDNNKELGSDEEEEALRALLLSKIPKHPKDSASAVQPIKAPTPKIGKTNYDTSGLRSLLLVKNVDQPVAKGPTETILKEAVRRLQIKTVAEKIHPESVLCDNNNHETNISVGKIACDHNSVHAKSNVNDLQTAKPASANVKEITKTVEREETIVQNHKNCENLQTNPHLVIDEINTSNHDVCLDKGPGDVLIVNDVCTQPETSEITGIKIESEALKPRPNENKIAHCSENELIVPKLKSSICEKRKHTSPKEIVDKFNSNKLIKLKAPERQSGARCPPITQQLSTKDPSESSSYSRVSVRKVLKPIVRPIKIVKPHKVINTSRSSTLKHKTYDSYENRSKAAEVTSVNGVPGGLRVVTPSNFPECRVEKLIISLRESDTESNEEEELYKKALEKSVLSVFERSETPDSLLGILNDDCYGNLETNTTASSLGANDDNTSLKIESSKTCGDDTPKFGDSFEKKLDNFLRDVRSKVQKNSSSATSEQRKQNIHDNDTPTAVRHLPAASQEEYKRLIHRMQMLEQQRQLKNAQKKVNDVQEVNTGNKVDKEANAVTISKPLKALNDFQNRTQGKISTGTDDALKTPNASEQSIKKSLMKKVFAKNTIKRKTILISKKVVNSDPSTQENVKLNQLQAFEDSFYGVSTSIITNLDKSLRLVEEAKNAKIAKMRYSRRLKELRLELEEMQRKFKEEQDKMSELYPQICSSTEMIATLREKHTKIHEAATKLGKSIKGDEYRLDNDLKKDITIKSKSLAAQIKFVNSIKYCDLDKLEKNVDVTSGNNVLSAADYKIEKEICDAGVLKSEQNAVDVQVVHKNCINEQPQSNIQQKSEIYTLLVLPTTTEGLKVGATTCEQKTAVELKNKDTEDTKVQETEKYDWKEENILLPKYVSPLAHLRSAGSQWDPSGVICPYELMGQCEDKDCSYVHLTEREKMNSDDSAKL